MNLNTICEKYFATALLILTFSLATVNFSTPEYGVYSSMTESIVEDGDLNIANQLFYPEQQYIVSKSFNYPHHHSSGAVAGWLPFALYAKVVSKIFDIKDSTSNLDLDGNQFIRAFNIPEGGYKFFLHLTLVFGNIFITCFAIYLLFKNKTLFNKEKSYSDFAILLLATPLIYYMTIEPGSSNNMALLIVALILSFIDKSEIETKDIITLGLIWGVGFTIRVGTAFYLPIILWIIRKNINIKNIFLLLLFGALGAIPHFINDAIRFGNTVFGYSQIFKFNPILLLETMFSPYKGIFLFSPILLFSIIAGLRTAKEKGILSLESAILVTVFTKLFFFGNTYSHGGGVFGARQFIQDIPLFFILFNGITTQKNRNIILYLSLFISSYFLAFFLYRGLNIPLDIAIDDYTYRWTDSLHEPWSHKLHFIIKLVNFLIPGAILVFFWKKMKPVYITGFLVVSIYCITTVNLINNKSNIKKMDKEGYFNNAQDVNTIDAALAYENIGSLEERVMFLLEQNRIKEAKQTIKVRKRYIKRVLRSEEFISSAELFDFLPELQAEPLHVDYINRVQ